MRKNVFFVLFGAFVLLTMNACKDDVLDLDKELKFTKLSVETQKANIEQNGLNFMTAVEGMQDTKGMIALMNLLDLTGGELTTAPMQQFAKDIQNARKNALSNFDKQMRASYIDSEVWGEYSYNPVTEEMEQVKTLSNKLILNFPATATATTNNAKITVTYEDSSVEIPGTVDTDLEGVKFPSKITMVMTVDGVEKLTASFNGKYNSDGSPQELTESLKMDAYVWTTEIKNNNKTLSESVQIVNGTVTLFKSKAEINGKLTESALNAAMEEGAPEDAISGVAVYAQVMNVAVKAGTTNVKGLMNALKGVSGDLSEQAYMQKQADILNKYMVCTAYFADNNLKFADVELYVVEYTDEYGSYDPIQEKYMPQTYYDLAPRFVLSDGSKVTAEEYVMNSFDEIIDKLNEMVTPK